MILLVLYCFIVGLVNGKSILSGEQCLSKNGDLYTLMSTMTPYDAVRGDVPVFRDCKPESIWAFIRHGTRYPHGKQIARYANMTNLSDQIIDNHANSRGQLCPEDLAMLKDWRLDVDINQDMLLTISGIEELQRFGARIGMHFPNLVKPYSPSTVDIRITSLERTRQSAEAFVSGLYRTPMRIPNSFIDDPLLKNERNCSAWKPSTKSEKLHEQLKLLRNSPDMINLIRSVSRRLGFQSDLDFDVIKDIYDVCTFEYAWYHDKKTTPWCAAFTKDQLRVMEYNEDLRYYHKSAFGNALTPKLGCALVKDMMERLSSDMPKSTLYFGHSLGMRKLLTTLGIGEDTLLSGDNYANSDDRKWRSSYLTPFAANVIGVHYTCKKGSHGIKESSRIGIFVNEKLTPLPACGSREMCGLEEYKEKFSSLTDPSYCNRDFCQNTPYDNLFTDNDYYDEDD